GLVASVLVGGLFGLSNATSRPAFLALGSELSPRYRGALLGLLSLTNQGGTVLGSSLGGLAIGLGSYSTLALLTLFGGLTAAAIAISRCRIWMIQCELPGSRLVWTMPNTSAIRPRRATPAACPTGTPARVETAASTHSDSTNTSPMSV